MVPVFANEFPKPSQEMIERVARLKVKGLTLIDYHIHLRGGMTAEKAFDWEQQSGIKSGVLENTGKDWPLSDNKKLAAFIEDAQRFPLLIGIQVNDRDWYKTTDKKLLAKLNYVLADTMIMNDETGKPQKLWLENQYAIKDVQSWLERYWEHCKTVVNEPITILANPTYLPPRMEQYYDTFWTEERIGQFLDAGIKNGVAFEIQSPSKFPKRIFIELARKKGAKLTIGRNNHDDHPEELKRSLDLLEEFNITPNELLVLPDILIEGSFEKYGNFKPEDLGFKAINKIVSGFQLLQIGFSQGTYEDRISFSFTYVEKEASNRMMKVFVSIYDKEKKIIGGAERILIDPRINVRNGKPSNMEFFEPISALSVSLNKAKNISHISRIEIAMMEVETL
jgi:hypothetical protein